MSTTGKPMAFYDYIVFECDRRARLSPEDLKATIEEHGTFPFYPTTLKCSRCNDDFRSIGIRVESLDEYGQPMLKYFTAKEPVFCGKCEEMIALQEKTCNDCGRTDRFKGMQRLTTKHFDKNGNLHTTLNGWGWSFICPHCQKPDEPAELAMKKRICDTLDKIPPLYREFKPELVVDFDQVSRISAQYDYSEKSDKSKMHMGMLIFGKPDTGKTWAGFEVMKKHAEAGKDFSHYRCIDLQVKLQGESEEREPTETKLKGSFALMIDGFGEGINGIAVLEAYRRIIVARSEWSRPTILITRKTATELKGIAHERTMKDSRDRAVAAMDEILRLITNPNRFVVYELRNEHDRKAEISYLRQWTAIKVT